MNEVKSNAEKQEMVLRNYDIFKREHKRLLLAGYAGKWVVISPDGEIGKILDTEADAHILGESQHGYQNYSIQQVKSRPDSFGFLSSAKRIRS